MGAKKCLFLYSFLICWVKTTKLKIWSFVHRHSYYLLPSLHCEVYTPSLPSVPPSISVILLQPWSYLISIICDNDIKTDLYQEIIICYSDHNLGIVLILLFASVDSPPPPTLLFPPTPPPFSSLSAVPLYFYPISSVSHYCTLCSKQGSLGRWIVCLVGCSLICTNLQVIVCENSFISNFLCERNNLFHVCIFCENTVRSCKW